MSLKLTKHHGLGNDFLIALAPEREITDDDVRQLCDRRCGIGADGLIVGLDRGDGAERWQMILRNSDGSAAEISGNGLRCFAQAIARQRGLENGSDCLIQAETAAGERSLTILGYDSESLHATVQVEMGQAVIGAVAVADLGWDAIEAEDRLSVDLGNPHVVGFVDSLSGLDAAVFGPGIEAAYPAGVNVHMVEVVGPSSLKMLIWERGAGVTQACGSGACAAFVAAFSLGKVDSSVDVEMPGGRARVEFKDGSLLLTGSASFVAEVVVP